MSHYQGTDQLIQYIRAEMKDSPMQHIPFGRYMELSLYHPTAGYYMKDRPKIGKEGDFYTSSNLGSMMGEMLAAKIAHIIEENFHKATNEQVRIVEWGAGTGRLGVQILETLEGKYPEMYRRIAYTIVEQSEYHRQQSQEQFDKAEKQAEWWTEDQFYERNDQSPVIVIANELLDAFPVERVRYLEGERGKWSLEQQFVSWDEGSAVFVARWSEAVPDVEAYVREHVIERGIRLQAKQELEVNLGALAWIRKMAAAIRQGYCIIIDYGDQTKELASAHRMKGTLICYHRHLAHDNPYINVGDQDITAHVDFTVLESEAAESGFVRTFYGTQKYFLMEAGLLNQLQEHYTADPFDPIAKRNRAIRQLLLSDQMSELFKVWIGQIK
ncbi:class I SAM-dependent methyltransferase [Paenibacillus guangzhouensis]|uniref:class I SAM-dependent methyltransferase n=1 Tax=Paenibacillus guangzhouensis TaxID=1473112 RepID=UPI00187B2F3F|nr:SAM-dependent methyltransferase [Paenibacillus guangzhouensis]